MARKKKEEKETKQVSSLEVITETEKHFINLCRNFKCEQWLVELITENVNEIVCSLTDRSINNSVLSYILENQHTKNIDESNIMEVYDHKTLEIQNDEEYIEKTSDFWYEKVMNAITGELALPDEQ